MLSEEREMVQRDEKNSEPDGPETGHEASAPQAGTAGADDCRCKKVAGMTPRQLLAQMLSDVAFWKKEKQG
jgi:hypothetical protein